jgi:probable rRNA maturation factor
MTPSITKPTLELALQFAVKGELMARLPPRRDFRHWAKAALRTDVSATLRIVAAEEGLALNRDYRGKDYATNVLTFEYGADPDTGVRMGDIVLCAPVVEEEAREQGKTLDAHYAHLTVHGLLHLQGYDHELGEREAVTMEAVESFIMQALGFPNPYNPL